MQIDEAEGVRADVSRDILTLSTRINAMRQREAELGRVVEQESNAFVSPALDEFLAATRAVSDMEAELARARNFLEQGLAADAIRHELHETLAEIAELEEKDQQRRRRSKSRLQRLRDLYREVLKEVDFPDLRAVSIDGNTLMPKINGQLYVHSGTAFTGLAVTCYHLALLRLSLQSETYFPRLLVIDSPAVGDLNDENHDDLLNYIARLHGRGEDQLRQSGDETTKLPWQIILTTRRITPALEPYEFMKISSRPSEMLLRKRRGSTPR